MMSEHLLENIDKNVAVILKIVEDISQISGKNADKSPKERCEDNDEIREYILNLMKKAGLKASCASGGGISARLEGKEAGLPPVALVSRFGYAFEGKYSKALGVASSLAVVDYLARNSIQLDHPVEIIILGDSSCQGGLKSFLELNVDHGGALSKEGAAVGIVKNIASPTKLKIIVEGMTERADKALTEGGRDALASSAMIVLAVRDIAVQKASDGLTAVVKEIRMPPGGTKFAPDKVEMMVDIRGTKHSDVIEVLQEIKDEVSAISEEQDTTVSIEVLSSQKPVRLDGDISQMIENICQEQKLGYVYLDSLTEYGAMNVSSAAKGALLLIPCSREEGNLEENVSEKDIEAGIRVLTEVLCRLAK